MKAISICFDGDEGSAEFKVIKKWLDKWSEVIEIETYFEAGWYNYEWNVRAPEYAICELPKHLYNFSKKDEERTGW